MVLFLRTWDAIIPVGTASAGETRLAQETPHQGADRNRGCIGKSRANGHRPQGVVPFPKQSGEGYGGRAAGKTSAEPLP
jgi:hypothetical protein